MSASSSKPGLKNWIRFLIPSGIGVLFFLTPIVIDGQITIGMAYVGDLFINNFQLQLSQLAGIFIVSSVLFSFLFAINERAKKKLHWLSDHLTLHPFWFTMRMFGAIAAVAYLFQVGPEFLTGVATSGTTLGNLIPITMTYLGIGAVFLPLLVDFGLMELVGVMLSRIFDRVFGLPGRSAIDAMASWMGSGPVGVFITSQQYERGFYTAREAAVICTNFSVVSVSFSLVVIEYIGLGHLFLPYYLSVIGIGFIAALITPRLPPLNRIADNFIDGNPAKGSRTYEPGVRLLPIALNQALDRAANAPSSRELVQRVGRNVAEIWLSLIPVVMGLGTTALILAEYTPVFTWLGAPIAPILNLFQLEEAQAAAPLILVGFTDMYLPALVGVNINSELTRFVVATVSVTQLIYMSEVGALIIKSNIPLGFINVAQIFILRTLISLPIAVIIGHLLL
ncbi:MAG: YjiH family protein [Gammaproteobacteria bacterium]|nr:YjiH family protein [Gammaproteobacteria bacterium]